MRIRLSGAGKRFNREWIFRKADLDFKTGISYAITGPNGSGKSTLLQCIGGMLQLSEGSIQFLQDDKQVTPEKIFEHISFCAPYQEVMEEMSLLEFLQFHASFKSFIRGFTPLRIAEIMDLKGAEKKQIRLYSSGMKQRVKLAQAVFTNAAVVLLDEPCSNLDANGIQLYHQLISDYCRERIVIVCSNDPVEYSFCSEVIRIGDYKV